MKKAQFGIMFTISWLSLVVTPLIYNVVDSTTCATVYVNDDTTKRMATNTAIAITDNY